MTQLQISTHQLYPPLEKKAGVKERLQKVKYPTGKRQQQGKDITTAEHQGSTGGSIHDPFIHQDSGVAQQSTAAGQT